MSFEEIEEMGKKLINNPKNFCTEQEIYKGTINGFTIFGYVNEQSKKITLYPEF